MKKILIVVWILVIGILFYFANEYARIVSLRKEQAKIFVAYTDMRSNIELALKLYRLDNDAYPTTSQGLDALMVKPEQLSNWKGPYLIEEPLDPWGNPYVYTSDEGGFVLHSSGADKVKGTKDDIRFQKFKKTGNRVTLKAEDAADILNGIENVFSFLRESFYLEDIRLVIGGMELVMKTPSASNAYEFITEMEKNPLFEEVKAVHIEKVDEEFRLKAEFYFTEEVKDKQILVTELEQLKEKLAKIRFTKFE